MIEKNYLEGRLNIKKATDQDFYKFCEAKIKQQKGDNAFGTWKHKKAYLNKLKEFKPRLNFSEITPSFMLDFENHCRTLGNKSTTIWSKVKFITTMINAALADEVILEDPKANFKSKPYVDPERNFLTGEEIERIEKFANESKNRTLVKVSDWFLFGCYTGLRYSDVKSFDLKKIVNGRVILRTEKKQKDVSIKLHSKLEKVLARMQPGVFTNQKVNEYLKIIAVACDIEKSITFHVSRHSFSVYFLTGGGSIETLSKILGHSSIKTTAIYGKIINLKIDREMSKVWL
jgi:site-specific recombinase XerD